MSDKQRPRDSLVRAVFPGIEYRDAGKDGKPILSGHFSVFNEWTMIRSAWEGTFLERVAPGAFKKTISENRERVRVLLNHGRDPQLGDKPIGSILELREDEKGAWFEVQLFAGIPDIVMEGLRSVPPSYGSSMRFNILLEDYDEHPKRSDYNPTGMPERTIREARLAEFGPVTFPAYSGATASVREDGSEAEYEVRCLTDRYQFDGLSANPDLLRELIDGRQQTRTIVTRAPNATVTFTSRGVVVDDKPKIKEGAIETRATWDTSYINDLPDSAFLYVEDGGKKDGEGKTVPRSLRHFPVKDASGNVDLPHLRNALARIPQSNLPQAVKDAATAKAKRMLANENKASAAVLAGELRMDLDDLSLLTCMARYGQAYIDAQDDDDDPTNTTKMQAIIDSIAVLVKVEADEPSESDDDDSDGPMSYYSAQQDGTERDGMPVGVKACSMNGTSGYTGGKNCHLHDGTEAGKTKALALAQADVARSSESDSSESTTPSAEPEPSGATTRTTTTQSGLIIPNVPTVRTTSSGLIIPD